MARKLEPPKDYPAPWHLEGPLELDGMRWGNDIAIVASNGECVIHDWNSDSWRKMSVFLVRTVNAQAGFPDAPVRPSKDDLNRFWEMRMKPRPR